MIKIDNPKFRKAMKVLSVVSVLVLIVSALFSLHILIKYKDYPEFASVKESELYLWQYFQPEKYRAWLVFRSDFGMNVVIILAGMALFIVSGIPLWIDNARDPKRMFSKHELKILRKIKGKFLK